MVDQVIPVDPGYIQMGGQYGHNSVEFLVHPRFLENPESAQEEIASSKSKDWGILRRNEGRKNKTKLSVEVLLNGKFSDRQKNFASSLRGPEILRAVFFLKLKISGPRQEKWVWPRNTTRKD